MADVYQLLYTSGMYSSYTELTIGFFDSHDKAVGMAGTFSRLSDARLTDLLGEWSDGGEVVIRKYRLNRFRPSSKAFREAYGGDASDVDEKIYTVEVGYYPDDWGDQQFNFVKEDGK